MAAAQACQVPHREDRPNGGTAEFIQSHCRHQIQANIFLTAAQSLNHFINLNTRKIEISIKN